MTHLPPRPTSFQAILLAFFILILPQTSLTKPSQIIKEDILIKTSNQEEVRGPLNLNFTSKTDPNHNNILEQSEVTPEQWQSLSSLDLNQDCLGVSKTELTPLLEKQYHKFVNNPKRQIWLQSFRTLPPMPKLFQKFTLPILMVQGQRDLQTPFTDFPSYIDTIRARRHEVNVLAYRTLGHTLSYQPLESPPALDAIDPLVVEDLVQWVDKTLSLQRFQCRFPVITQ